MMKDRNKKHPLIKIYYHLLIPNFLGYICVGIGLISFIISLGNSRYMLISFFVTLSGFVLWFIAKLLTLILDVLYFYFEEKGIKCYTSLSKKNDEDGI